MTQKRGRKKELLPDWLKNTLENGFTAVGPYSVNGEKYYITKNGMQDTILRFDTRGLGRYYKATDFFGPNNSPNGWWYLATNANILISYLEDCFRGYNDDADSNYPLDTTSSSTPWEWSFWEDTVTFYPTPDTVQTIYVRALRNPTPFGFGSGASDVPDLPSPFHPILATYATARAYMQQEDPVMAQQYQAQFQIELDNVARRYADTPAPQPMIANSRRSSRYLAGFGTLRYANSGGVEW